MILKAVQRFVNQILIGPLGGQAYSEGTQRERRFKQKTGRYLIADDLNSQTRPSENRYQCQDVLKGSFQTLSNIHVPLVPGIFVLPPDGVRLVSFGHEIEKVNSTSSHSVIRKQFVRTRP